MFTRQANAPRALLASVILGATTFYSPFSLASVSTVAKATTEQSTELTSGTCEGGAFWSWPPTGSTVVPGQSILYYASVLVEGGSVLGCARDIWLSEFVRFWGGVPEIDYWPDTTEGPMATWNFSGPFESGTRLHAAAVVQVHWDAPNGTVITAFSASTISHTVHRRR